MVYTCFVTSMFFYMAKSRCMKVGADIGKNFEPIHMQLMASKISSMIDLTVPFSKDYYVNKERIIPVDAYVEIKVCLDLESFKML